LSRFLRLQTIVATPSPGTFDDRPAAGRMEADVSAGPPAASPIRQKLSKPAMAETDIADNNTAKSILEENPATEVELEDAMSRIQDFFALEGTFGQLNDKLHASSRSRLGGQAPNLAANSPALSAPARPAFEISHPISSSQPFGPPSASLHNGQLQSPSQHRGDCLPAKALGGSILGLRAHPLGRTGAIPEEDLASPEGHEHLPIGSQQPRRNWRVDAMDEEEVPQELFGNDRNARRPHTDRTDLIAAASMSELQEDTFKGAVAPSKLAGFATDGPRSPRPSSSSSSTLKAAVRSSPVISSGASPSSNFQQSALWKLRLGITPTGTAEDQNMRYVHIQEKGREQFQHFAKALIDQLSVECAESNPYVKALCAHRQEMQESTLDLRKEVVDSLAARLGTEREDNLATMTVSEERERRTALGFSCQRQPCEGSPRFAGEELFLPELEARYQHHQRWPRPGSPTGSTDRSTTACSAHSDTQARRAVVVSGQEDQRLRLRIGRNRLELSEDDRSSFLEALGGSGRHSALSMANAPTRCGGDATPRMDLD